MTNSKSEKWYLAIITGGIYLCLFIPLIVSGRFVFPFIFPKVVVFRTIIEVIFFFYLLLALQNPAYRPKLSLVGKLLILYFVILIIASLFGVNFYRSFWSNVERSDGLIVVAHFLIFFLIVSSVFKERAKWYNLLNFSVIASLLVTLYALAQQFDLGSRFNLAFLLHSGESRLSATIGNASFLAAYLIFNIAFAIILLSQKKAIGWRIFYFLALFLEIYVLYNTQTRGAVLSFFVGIVIFVFLSIILSQNKKIKKAAIVSLLVIIVFVVLIWLNADKPWVKKNPTLGRIVSISSTDITTQARILTWQASMGGWHERFWLGWGYENYNIVFNKYFPAGLILDIGSRVWYDRAHNIIFDIGVTSGLVGLSTYLGILISAIILLWQKFKKNHEDYYLYIFLLILLIVYFGQNFFVFDTPASYLMFYLTLALINFLILEKKISQESVQEKKIIPQKLSFPVALTLFVIFLFVFYIVNLKPARANLDCIRAVTIEKQGLAKEYFNEIINYFKKSFSYQTYQNAEFRQYLADFVAGKIRENQIPEKDLAQIAQLSASELKKSIEEEPMNVRNYIYLMTLYNNSFKFDKSQLDEVIKLGNQAIPLSPTRPHIYFEMAQSYVFKGDFDKAIEYFKKGLELNNRVVDFNWSLAAVYILAGKTEEASQQFDWMVKNLNFKYDTVENLSRLIRVYTVKNDFQKLTELYNKLIEFDPNKAEYHAKLAFSYAQIGQKDKAIAEVKKAVELDPSYAQEAEKFLKELESPQKK
ncbi:MAG: O-antigen ligase family protein [bacterium]